MENVNIRSIMEWNSRVWFPLEGTVLFRLICKRRIVVTIWIICRKILVLLMFINLTLFKELAHWLAKAQIKCRYSLTTLSKWKVKQTPIQLARALRDSPANTPPLDLAIQCANQLATPAKFSPKQEKKLEINKAQRISSELKFSVSLVLQSQVIHWV